MSETATVRQTGTRVTPPAGEKSLYQPLVQLTLVRFREFLREPEALFWVFVFPILLAAGLGIAFRNRPAEVLTIATVTPELAQALRPEKLLDTRQLSPAQAQQQLMGVPAAATQQQYVPPVAQPAPAAESAPAGVDPATWARMTPDQQQRVIAAMGQAAGSPQQHFGY